MTTALLSQFEQQYSVQTAEATAKIGRLQLIEVGKLSKNPKPNHAASSAGLCH